MVVPLCKQPQHPREALNPCLTQKENALWMLNRCADAGRRWPRETWMRVDGGNAVAA
jgi:hypothetical protein